MDEKKFLYYAIHKPFGVLSQFTDRQGRRTLAEIHNFQRDVYPIGRLDQDSEGLLLLSNEKKLTDFLLNPDSKQEKEYFAQVEGIPEEEDLDKLREGVIIEGKKTLPAKVKKIEPPDFPPRVPPIRERKNIPVSWLSITIVEGRHRQVRKMTANIGFPTLRLIRVRIKNIELGNLKSGEFRIIKNDELKILKGEK